jgi:hypothetical protein
MTTETPILRPTYDDRPNRPRITTRKVALPGPLPEGIEYPPELIERLRTLERLSGDFAGARRQLNEAESGRLAAERADRAAYATALRADSGAVPHGNALAQVEASIAQLTERIAALRIARDGAEADLVAYLEQHRADAAGALEPAIEAARTARGKALRLLDQTDARLDSLLATSAWLTDPFHRPVAPPRNEARG